MREFYLPPHKNKNRKWSPKEKKRMELVILESKCINTDPTQRLVLPWNHHHHHHLRQRVTSSSPHQATQKTSPKLLIQNFNLLVLILHLKMNLTPPPEANLSVFRNQKLCPLPYSLGHTHSIFMAWLHALSKYPAQAI